VTHERPHRHGILRTESFSARASSPGCMSGVRAGDGPHCLPACLCWRRQCPAERRAPFRVGVAPRALLLARHRAARPRLSVYLSAHAGSYAPRRQLTSMPPLQDMYLSAGATADTSLCCPPRLTDPVEFAPVCLSAGTCAHSEHAHSRDGLPSLPSARKASINTSVLPARAACIPAGRCRRSTRLKTPVPSTRGVHPTPKEPR
jgi:hypothetical protein